MRPLIRNFFGALISILAVVGPAPDAMARENAPRVERAWSAFLDARSPKRAEKAARSLAGMGIGFDEAWDRLRTGRSYPVEVETGLVWKSHRVDGFLHQYVFLIPADYDPANPYPVTVYLHGTVLRSAPEPRERWWLKGLQADEGEILVVPAAWKSSTWWMASQSENIAEILDDLKRSYNIDENRVALMGVSDGGTGTFFQAFRNTTPWASFLPFIGNPEVLGNPKNAVDGDMFPVNLSNKPLFVVNGARDHRYPTWIVLPYLQLLADAGARIVFRQQAESGHDLRWWSSETENISSFIATHPRDPLPDRLVWETERADRYNRAHWLVIEQLGSVPGESDVPDYNTVVVPPTLPPLGIVPGEDSTRLTVREVRPRGLAAGSGFQAGDIIVDADGVPISDLASLGRVLADTEWGSTVVFGIARDGEEMQLEVQYPPKPDTDPLRQAFPRSGPSGRVEVERQGNTVVASTRGVRVFRLLLSPDEFDLSEPIRIEVNGTTVFEEPVAPSTEALLTWAARDNDRSMLFAAEIVVDVATGQCRVTQP